MSAPALIRKQDMMRAAEVANETSCRIDIKIGDAVVSIIPHAGTTAPDIAPKKSDGIDYSRPVL
ncbi:MULTISPECIES: hypothetical protein [unclassified Shinella]|uniref:hypothetical protein n=1 Tax=unclassified Shinella TaxID=2643062 RepID=UPI00225CD123|nr:MULTISPECIES: hypothetical protein [unclassified Shinella]MCO5140851.1 hypothetical protein [Shinella sp.]MDC7256460.1 hypothetical protein [Shinella sp. YE25]CAI0339327.1 conserved hypothetical protein [Rhizobiaceae bacterium]CAK7257733.1 conserved protein of unknown function [Shinella sp. WSC3-e]